MRNRKAFVDMTFVTAKLVGVFVLALSGCAHSYRLVPMPGTAATQGPGQAVAGESADVRMVASAQIWSGDPPTLSQFVLPIWVEIENHSGKPLWLRYSGLRMEDPNGKATLHAIPPFKVKGNTIIPASAVRPEFHGNGFYVVPLLRPSYIGLDDPWQGSSLEPDFAYYGDHGVEWEETLPTDDMLRRAIPEGVVADGGKVAGFVYFQRMKAGFTGLILRNDLVDAVTKQPFGRVDIPFAVVKE
jgi:hypothetical protein